MKEYKDGVFKELEEVTPKDEGQKILLKGMVIGQGDVEHYPLMIVTECPRCSIEDSWEQDTLEDDWRSAYVMRKCDRCAEAMREKEVKKGMVKKIIVAEQNKDNPIFLTCFIYGDDINRIVPGKEIRMEGILRSRKNKKTDLTYKKLFDVLKFRLEEDKLIMPTEDEIKEFDEMDKTEIIKSVAPHIKNMYTLKEALLISSLGGVERDTFRGDINTLMLGDPGTAKTQLLKFVKMMNQKSDYVSGTSASGAGLFGGIDKTPDGTHYARAGAAVMCNGGVLGIDEMEKMNDNDRVYAHEVMESQTFTLRKIVPVTWQVKISIIGAANPKKSRWNTELTINENVNMPDSLLSRFGLIFLVRDIPNKSDDLAIAEHLEKVLMGELEQTLPVDKLMKFINHAKHLRPKPTREALEKVKEWWADLRNTDQVEGSIAVDHRTLYDLHRMAQAYAKLDLSDIVDTKHAQRAIDLLKESLKTLGMNTPGERNASLVNQFDKQGYIAWVFEKPISHDAAISKLCEKPKWFPSEIKAAEMIRDLKRYGKILESGDKYSWVS